MGLMYILPIKEEESEHVVITQKTSSDGQIEKSITVKSYGLPMVFWGYWLAATIVISALGLAVWAPVTKLAQSGEVLDILMVTGVLGLLFAIPLIGLGFLFFEIRIIKRGHKLQKQWRLFGLPFWKKSITLPTTDSFEVRHHLDSPNMAKISKNQELLAFANHGHYHLFVKDVFGNFMLLDRHSRKSDVARLADLLRRN